MHDLLRSSPLLLLVGLCGCGLAWGQAQPAPKTAPPAKAPAKAAPTQDTPPARQNPPPKNNADRKPDEAKSPVVRSLLEQLNQFPAADGTADERGQIRDMLWGADEELARSLGENARKSIVAANKRRPAFDVMTRKRREALMKKEKAAPKTGEPKQGEPTPAVPPMPAVKPPLPEVKPAPKPMKAPDDPF